MKKFEYKTAMFIGNEPNDKWINDYADEGWRLVAVTRRSDALRLAKETFLDIRDVYDYYFEREFERNEDTMMGSYMKWPNDSDQDLFTQLEHNEQSN